MGSAQRRNSTRARKARSAKPSSKSRRKPVPKSPVPVAIRDELSRITATISVCVDAAAHQQCDALAVTLLERVQYPLRVICGRLAALAKVRS